METPHSLVVAARCTAAEEGISPDGHQQVEGRREPAVHVQRSVPSSKSEILSFAAEWMELENMLNKVIQTQKDKFLMRVVLHYGS